MFTSLTALRENLVPRSFQPSCGSEITPIKGLIYGTEHAIREQLRRFVPFSMPITPQTLSIFITPLLRRVAKTSNPQDNILGTYHNLRT